MRQVAHTQVAFRGNCKTLEKEYGSKIDILTRSNVLDEDMEEPLRDLADRGCDIIFFNGYSELVMQLAEKYPNVWMYHRLFNHSSVERHLEI